MSSAVQRFIWCSKCSTFIPVKLYAPEHVTLLMRHIRGDKSNFERVKMLAHALHVEQLARRS
jgi:hypothetical protein